MRNRKFPESERNKGSLICINKSLLTILRDVRMKSDDLSHTRNLLMLSHCNHMFLFRWKMLIEPIFPFELFSLSIRRNCKEKRKAIEVTYWDVLELIEMLKLL